MRRPPVPRLANLRLPLRLLDPDTRDSGWWRRIPETGAGSAIYFCGAAGINSLPLGSKYKWTMPRVAENGNGREDAI